MAYESILLEREAPVTAATEDAERIARLRLARSRNVGPRSFIHLIARHGGAVAALDALPGTGGYAALSEAEAVAEIERGEAASARLVMLGDPGYPPRLLTIAGAPPVLWIRGAGAAFEGRAMAVVGARNASALGLRLARRLGLGLAASGTTVVSGLARGIDTAAHEGALAAAEEERESDPGTTIAVMAGGIDVVYPAENQGLAARIAAEGGALLSECPPGTVPAGRHFPRRNRLVSGLAEGVVLVEAAIKSGSMITARAALEQGREVMACPGAPDDPRTGGCNALIRDGAALIRGVPDILDALTLPRHRPPALPGLAEAGDPFEPPAACGNEPTHEPAEAPEGEALAARILALLSLSPIEIDDIARTCRTSRADLSLALLELELAGRLARHDGGRLAALPG
ncbi:MAG: DNA-processing protein DprA [Pseudomonadota bacterium]